jgi:hypothetical protein
MKKAGGKKARGKNANQSNNSKRALSTKHWKRFCQAPPLFSTSLDTSHPSTDRDHNPLLLQHRQKRRRRHWWRCWNGTRRRPISIPTRRVTTSSRKYSRLNNRISTRTLHFALYGKVCITHAKSFANGASYSRGTEGWSIQCTGAVTGASDVIKCGGGTSSGAGGCG